MFCRQRLGRAGPPGQSLSSLEVMCVLAFLTAMNNRKMDTMQKAVCPPVVGNEGIKCHDFTPLSLNDKGASINLF